MRERGTALNQCFENLLLNADSRHSELEGLWIWSIQHSSLQVGQPAAQMQCSEVSAQEGYCTVFAIR